MNELTNGENIVLSVFKLGLRRNKIIARELSITEKTVKKHLRNIYKKMNVRSRYELDALLNK